MDIKEVAARIIEKFSGLRPGTVVQPCPCAPVTTGLGADVDSLAAKSPTLQKNLAKLKNDRWKVEYGTAGKGSYCDKSKKKIIIDPNEKGHHVQIVQTLAHESGHALYTPDAYVAPTGITRQNYVNSNVTSALKDEGEATMMNCQIRAEIIANGGADIGIAGAQASEYQKIYNKYPNPGSRETARKEIGDLFADGEQPSTDPTKTYRDYYAQPFADFYDAQDTGK